MTMKIGVCFPVRPAAGMPNYEHPEKWGCLRSPIHDPLWESLFARTDVDFQAVDFRDAIVLNGEVHIEGEAWSDWDALFWYCEIDRSPGSFHLQILKTLARNVPVFPDPWKFEKALDKFTAHEQLQQAGLPVPEFLLFEAGQVERIAPVLEKWGSAMLKPRRGAWGKGVSLVEDFNALRDLVGYIQSVTGGSPDQGFLLERYYDNDIHKWLSVTVIGGEVMIGYRKRNSKVVPLGDGKFKIYDPQEKGGAVDYVEPSLEQREIALRAAEALDCPIIGFDMIWTAEGPMIIDENTSPGNYIDLYREAGKAPDEEICRMFDQKLATLKKQAVLN